MMMRNGHVHEHLPFPVAEPNYIGFGVYLSSFLGAKNLDIMQDLNIGYVLVAASKLPQRFKGVSPASHSFDPAESCRTSSIYNSKSQIGRGRTSCRIFQTRATLCERLWSRTVTSLFTGETSFQFFLAGKRSS